MDLDQALQTFIVEGRELLAEMEAALLRCRDSNELHRAAGVAVSA